MPKMTPACLAACAVLIGGCATTVEHYKTVAIKNPTNNVVTNCSEPLSTWQTKTEGKANLNIAYEAKAKLDQAITDLSSKGSVGFDLSAVKEQVRVISQQNFDYMSFLYPFCKANAEGKMSDADYVKFMQQLLDRFIKENAVSIRIDRTADMSQTRCADGARVYTNLVEDRLTFSEPVKEYLAQAHTSNVGGTHTAQMWYFSGDQRVTPITESMRLPLKGERKVARIPVNGTATKLFYRVEQRAEKGDDEWGLSFVSTLPIASIRARVILPSGKQVSGLHQDYSAERTGFGGCSFVSGHAPSVECPERIVAPNVPISLFWVWDVWDGC